MSAIRLATIRVEKPWGRTQLWPGFADASGAPVGEVWFDAPKGTDAELMVKYLFTSERLSIQVHPDDAAAQAAGHARGKDEAWIVLAAEPHSTIGIGLTHEVTRDTLRAAALDGSIETLLDWRSVKAGDVIYSPARTIHAIGAGLTLIEVQQDLDLTYRLYDYGRPRELHLEAGVAVADPVPFTGAIGAVDDAARQVIVDGAKFVIERWSTAGAQHSAGTMRWLIPVAGGGLIDGTRYEAGECWLVTGAVTITQDAGSALLWAMPRAADAASTAA